MLYLMVCFFNSSCVFRIAFITGVASNRGCVFPFHFELMVDEINKRTTKKVKIIKNASIGLLYSVIYILQVFFYGCMCREQQSPSCWHRLYSDHNSWSRCAKCTFKFRLNVHNVTPYSSSKHSP